jgi:molybdopterin-guanine dinucleotide biosynthesis protein A
MPLNDNANRKVTAVILAGGAGRRMDGQDKGLIPFRGRPLIAHVLEILAPQANKILINCNRNSDAYARFGYPLQQDNLPGGQGPLAGLLSALESVDSEYVLSVPCDTPFLPPRLVERMLDKLQQSGADTCTVDDGDRLHPVIMLVRRSTAPSLRAYLESGKRKVHDWFYSTRHCITDFSDQPEAFININTPDQLQAAEQS